MTPSGTEVTERKPVAFVPEEAFLGIPGKSVNPPPSAEALKQFRKVERWALQAASADILDTKAMRTCCRAVIPPPKKIPGSVVQKVIGVDVWKTLNETFHYGGLITCGSVWACPICAGKISERKRVELTSALAKNKEQGGSAQLWTFTAPHHLGESLKSLNDAMSIARRTMLNRKPWKRLISSLGVKGTIRGLEVTFSFQNGWHVHFHVLAVLSGVPALSLQSIEEVIYQLWRSACLDSGLSEPSRAHGVSVEGGEQAAAYVGKWGLEHEMTKGHIKKGKEGHLTPFDFLRQYLAGDLRYGPLFKEYAQEFKGKRQLVWSEGLRDRLDLGQEETDEEIAARQDEKASLFASIPLNVWRVILKQKKRGQVLEVCAQGQEALFDYMLGLMESAGEVGCG